MPGSRAPAGVPDREGSRESPGFRRKRGSPEYRHLQQHPALLPESGAPERAPACGSHSPARGASHEALRLERTATSDSRSSWRLTYSRRYGRTVWPRREVAGEVEEYISHFQLLPPRNAVREPITYYIDATLRQWFEDYGYRIGRRVRATLSLESGRRTTPPATSSP